MCPYGYNILNPHLKKLRDIWINEGISPYGTYMSYSDSRWADYYLSIPEEDRTVFAPCGKCFDCFTKRASSWRVRLINEYTNCFHSKGKDYAENHTIWTTLTFAPDYYVDDFDTQYEMIKWRIKCMRDSYRKKYGTPMRYYFITERGEDYGRTHLHGFIFNNKASYKELYNWWSVGRCDFESIRVGLQTRKNSSPFKAISYATSYCTKNFESFRDCESHIFVSQGLGATIPNYKPSDYRYLDGRLYPFIHIGEYKYSLPRYYRLKIYTDEERSLNRALLLIAPPPDKYWYGKGAFPTLRALFDYITTNPSVGHPYKQLNYGLLS